MPLDVCAKDSVPSWGYEYRQKPSSDSELDWYHRVSMRGSRWHHSDWYHETKAGYEIERRLTRVFRWREQRAAHCRVSSQADAQWSGIASARTEGLRGEFTALAQQWQCETQHLSQASRKVAHPAYLRIIGMGGAVVPLLLEALRDRPAHWFVALKSTANVDPVPAGVNPSAAREAWLSWGRAKGLIE